MKNLILGLVSVSAVLLSGCASDPQPMSSTTTTTEETTSVQPAATTTTTQTGVQ